MTTVGCGLKVWRLVSIYNPTNSILLSDKVHSAGEGDVDKAVDAAQKAFKGDWGGKEPTERAKAMFRFADLIRENAEDIVRLETLAMG